MSKRETILLIILIGLMMLTVSCAENEFGSMQQQSCSVENNVITCPDGTTVTINDGIDGIDGQNGNDGTDGSDGSDGASGVIHTQYKAGTKGKCYDIGGGYYVENEGSHIDVYNNKDCDHGPSPRFAYCNNVYEQEMCGINNIMVYIHGTYSNMIIHVLDFN